MPENMHESKGEIEDLAISGGVVVGDDGSAAATRAIVAGAEEARLRSVPLHVIRAWTIMTAARPADAPHGYVPSLAEFQDATTAQMRLRVTEILGEGRAEVHAVHGSPAATLIEASKSATMLVIGARGIGGFASLLVGSVAEKVIQHAECPVLLHR